jgi:MFS family permease
MARNLRLFYLFRLLATSYLWVPVFVQFMGSRGLSFTEIMLLGALYSFVVICVEVPTGAFADRMGRRRSMMLGALAMVASSLVAYHAYSFGVFAIAEVLAAVSMSLCSGADSAYLFDMLQGHGRASEYPRREAVASAWHQGGNAIAYAAGGLLGAVDLALPYLVTTAVALGAFVVAACLGGDRVPPQRPRQPLADSFRDYVLHMREALRDVRVNSRLAWTIAYSAVVFVLLRATVYLYQPYLDARGFSIAEIGLVFAAVYLLASFVAHRGDFLRRRFGEEVLLWGMLGTLAVSFILLNRTTGPLALFLLAVQAFANGLYSPLVKPMLNREIVDSSRRATVLSVESIARRSAIGVFSPIAGVYGASSALYLCGAVGLVGFTVLLVFAVHGPARSPAGGAPSVD